MGQIHMNMIISAPAIKIITIDCTDSSLQITYIFFNYYLLVNYEM